MKTCHGCNHPLEALAAVRTYHAGCDPRGRAEMLERALREILEAFEDAIDYIDDPGSPSNEFHGPTLHVLAGRNRILAARAALAHKPAQMKEREG